MINKEKPKEKPPSDKKFASVVIDAQYVCPHCGANMGDADSYRLNDEGKHELFIDAQEGVCDKCEKAVESKPYSITSPSDPA